MLGAEEVPGSLFFPFCAVHGKHAGLIEPKSKCHSLKDLILMDGVFLEAEARGGSQKTVLFSFSLSFSLAFASTSQRSWEMLQDGSKNGRNVRNCDWPCRAHIPKGSTEPRDGMQDARTPGHAPGHPHPGCPSLESSWLPFSTGYYFLQNPRFFPCIFLGSQEFPFPPEQTLLAVIHRAISCSLEVRAELPRTNLQLFLLSPSLLPHSPSLQEQPQELQLSSWISDPFAAEPRRKQRWRGAFQIPGDALPEFSQSLGGGGNAWQEGVWMRRGGSSVSGRFAAPT